MTSKDNRPEDAAPLASSGQTLRRQAEEKACSLEPQELEALSPEETGQMLHELRVYQIEMEMQNEELRRERAKLDAARARYFDLYNIAPVGYVTVSEPGLILEANLATATLLGVALDALSKQPISQFIFPEDQDIYYLHRKQLFATGEPQAYELRMVKQNGTAFWARLEEIAAQHTDGAPVSRIVLSDITEHKRAEEERAQLEAKLQQAQKMESIGRLAGGVAHDFNNLLQAMMGYCALLLKKLPAQDQTHEFADEILKGVNRAAALTQHLLAFARKQVIAPRVLDLNDTVTNMLKMLGRLIGEDIDLLWNPSRDIWSVKMDPSQINQILVNLVVNARDAIVDVGKVTIETGTATFDRGYCQNHPGFVLGQFSMLAVSDDGCGMEQAILVNIFEPFFTTKPLGQGTGLGLATVYGIVKQNEGFINVYSKPGEGTTFRIYLPRLPGDQAPEDERLETVETKTGTETILLVEDDLDVLKLTAQILTEQGFTVLAAYTPEQALQLVRERAGTVIHLVLTDVVMPGMNGRDLCLELVALRPGLRCLFMSGYTADIIAHHGVLENYVHFIQKPFSIQAIMAKVREVLDAPVA